MEVEFVMRRLALSEVFWETIESFVSSKRHLMCGSQTDLLQERATIYAQYIQEKEAPQDSCVRLIYCNKIGMSRPGREGSMQRSKYSGNNRMHYLVYQTITTLDGLIFSFYGPEESRRHDLILLRRSGITSILEECLLINERQFCVYGDAAYLLRPWIQKAYDLDTATEEQKLFKKLMSAVRVTVEWNYKYLKKKWSINDYERLLKV